jgi:hypothetical protein
MTENEPLVTPHGRKMKFTPERLVQIKNLIERGWDRQQIADTIGVTLGSLQVTCSKHGISLRKVRGTGAERPPCASNIGEATVSINGNPESKPKISLHFIYKGREKIVEIKLSDEMIGRLALEALFCNENLGELTADLIIEALAIRESKSNG